MAAASDVMGVLGVGTISSAMVRGLHMHHRKAGTRGPSFVLSSRNAAKAAALASEFPETVRIASSNQEVVDAAQLIIVAVLPSQTEPVLSALRFREGQKVLSVVSSLALDPLRALVSPASECVVSTPMPSVATLQGTSLATPTLPFAREIFSCLGTYIPAENETQYKSLQVITTLMGDFYKRQSTAQRWLAARGVPGELAAPWVAAIYKNMVADIAEAGPDTFEHKVAEQTPGGMNEMVWKEQEEDGSYESLLHSLDSVHHRLVTGARSPELAPAVKRRALAGADDRPRL